MPKVQSAETTTPKENHRESADDYRGEIFRHGKYRIAECRDGMQWLLQRLRPRISPGGAAWDTIAYCQTKRALSRLHRSLTGRQVEKVNELPERIALRASEEVSPEAAVDE